MTYSEDCKKWRQREKEFDNLVKEYSNKYYKSWNDDKYTTKEKYQQFKKEYSNYKNKKFVYIQELNNKFNKQPYDSVQDILF